MTDPQHGNTSTVDTDREESPRMLFAVVLGLPAVIFLMLSAFAAPAIHSGADDLPLAVAGPPGAVAELTGALAAEKPGAFDITTHDDLDGVVEAIEDRDAVGGIVVRDDGIQVLTASAAGAPYSQALMAIGAGLEQQGKQVTYRDVVPLTADDPTGAGLTALMLPLIFGGMASAVVLTFLFRRTGLRALGAVGISAVGGVAAAIVLGPWLGTFDGPFWPIAGAIGLGIASISLTVLGLEALLGAPGIAVGAVGLLFVSNPLSGIATGADWLPSPWGQIGQYLPLGAAGTTIRSVAFFDGAGSAHALVVSSCWILLGLALLALAVTRRRQRSVTTSAA